MFFLLCLLAIDIFLYIKNHHQFQVIIHGKLKRTKGWGYFQIGHLLRQTVNYILFYVSFALVCQLWIFFYISKTINIINCRFIMCRASERAKEREREGFLYVGFYLLPIAPPRPSATDLDSCDRSFLHPIVLLSKFVKICHCASASLRDRDPTFFPYDLCYVTHTLRFAPFRSKPSCLNHCYVQQLLILRECPAMPPKMFICLLRQYIGPTVLHLASIIILLHLQYSIQRQV